MNILLLNILYKHEEDIKNHEPEYKYDFKSEIEYEDINLQSVPPTIIQEFEVGNTRLCVTLYNDIMYLNSNSIKAIRNFITKLWLEGHLLSHIKGTKKTSYDIYKYLRVYKVISKGAPFSQN